MTDGVADVPCYDCSGTGEQHGFACGPGVSQTSWPCGTCKGSKVCPERDPAWRALGDELRELRVDLGFSMGDIARRFDLTVSQVSDAERGKTDPARLLLKVGGLRP